MANKIKFTINKSKFSEFISKLDDLTKIDDTIKLKIDSKNILMYSTLGGNVMLAFKNYLIETEDYLESKDEIEFTIDVIIAQAKKFVKNLNFIKDSEKVTIEFTYKESPDDKSIVIARSIQVIGGKLKVNWLGGESYDVRDINKSILDQRLNLKNRNWLFNLTKSEFTDIKKLSSINADKIISINVTNGKVFVSESAAWELEVSSIDERNANLILNKRFLSCIDDLDNIEFSMFDSFMLVKNGETNLMLSYEQDFDLDD